MPNLRLSFRDMIARFDVTARTLRYYEYIELLAPERAGRGRFYGHRDVARMTLILRGRRFGFSLEEIRQWLQLYDHEGEEAQLRTFVQFANAQLGKLQRQRDAIDAAIGDLAGVRTQAVQMLEQPGQGDHRAQVRTG